MKSSWRRSMIPNAFHSCSVNSVLRASALASFSLRSSRPCAGMDIPALAHFKPDGLPTSGTTFPILALTRCAKGFRCAAWYSRLSRSRASYAAAALGTDVNSFRREAGMQPACASPRKTPGGGFKGSEVCFGGSAGKENGCHGIGIGGFFRRSSEKISVLTLKAASLLDSFSSLPC